MGTKTISGDAKKIVLLGILLGVLFFTKTSHAQSYESTFDFSTNQPTYITEHDGTGGDIFPVPSGFTCQSNKVSFCSFAIDTNVGEYLMQPFTSPDDSAQLQPGTYHFVWELGSPCTLGDTFAVCSTITGNTWETFEVCADSSITTSTCPAATSTPATTAETIGIGSSIIIFIFSSSLWYYLTTRR